MKEKKFVLDLSRKEFLYLCSLIGSAGSFYDSDLFAHYFDCPGDDVFILNASINDKLVSLL